MIAPLRKRHRRVVATLALVVPVVFVLALAARPSWPVAEAQSTTLVRMFQSSRAEGLAIRLALLEAPEGRRLEVALLRDPERPDVLVYATHARVEGALPVDARLLGALGGTRPSDFAVTPELEGATLVFYSLGHDELFGTLALPWTVLD